MLRVYHYFSVRISVYLQKPKSSVISLCTILSFKSKSFMLYLQVITCSDDKKKLDLNMENYNHIRASVNKFSNTKYRLINILNIIFSTSKQEQFLDTQSNNAKSDTPHSVSKIYNIFAVYLVLNSPRIRLLLVNWNLASYSSF